MSWNYRIGTKLVTGTRLYSIIECYYDKQDKPNGHAEINALANLETLEDLKGAYCLIARAMNQPILDLDNWPGIYKEKDEQDLVLK